MPSFTAASPSAPAARLPWWGAAGGLQLLAGAWLLATDVPAWNTLWYLFGWYGWLLVLDAVLERLGGRSWLRHRRRELTATMVWSIPYWYFFEAYNLRLRNWYYVFALHDDRLQLLVSWLAFATVLPACFLHADLVAVLWRGDGPRWRPLRLTPAVRRVVVALGVASLVAPLLWPRWAFPLVWGALVWLPDLLSRRLGAPSLLGDLEAGRPRRLLQLLGGGLLAGVVWESLNYWARCKWIYTVPFFDRLKLFEMPVLGFLGFPVLALSAFATWSALSATLLGDVTAGAPERWRPPRAMVVAVGAASLLVSLFVYERMLVDTVASRRPLLAELRGLTAEDVMLLEVAGISTPERLEEAVAARGVAAVAAATGVSPDGLDPASTIAALALHKGMGTPAAALLQAVGVVDLRALAEEDPARLAVRLDRLANTVGLRPPREAEVAVWVRAAAGRTRPRR